MHGSCCRAGGRKHGLLQSKRKHRQRCENEQRGRVVAHGDADHDGGGVAGYEAHGSGARFGGVAFGGLALERVNELQQLQRVVGAVRDCAALPARQARLRYAGTLGDLGLTEAVRIAQGLDKVCGCRVHARILYAVA